MEYDRRSGFDGDFAPPPPPLVSLTPFSPSVSPSPRRLSSHFIQPSRPVRAARQLAWVSLQGRIVGAEEASSARTIGGGLKAEEVVAWELFSPIQRILIVAVVAVAASNSKKNKQIHQLRKSVELRDKVLLGMQQKLDVLCEEVNSIKEQPEIWHDTSHGKNVESLFNESLGPEKPKSLDCGCRHCDHHQPSLNDHLDNSSVKASRGDEMFKYKIPFSNVVEHEERRMSDLSDWASSVTSSVDIQLNTLAVEQDIYNLKKECEEKDASIKELFTLLQSSEVTGSKRIPELEDIIRRKNMRITKLKKDMLVLEQKVVQLIRLQRPSSSASSSNMRQHPVMAENLLYDMDNTTSPSSSDSDCPSGNRSQASAVESEDFPVQNTYYSSRRKEVSEPAKGYRPLVKPSHAQLKSRPVSPLKERAINQKPDLVSSFKPMQSLSAGGDFKNRRRVQTGYKAAAPQKRWV